MLLVIQYILMNYSTQTTMGIWISLNQVLDWSIMENGGHSEMRGAWMLLAYQHCIYLVFLGGVIAFPGKSMEHHKRRKKRRNDHNKIICHTYPWLSFDMQNPPKKTHWIIPYIVLWYQNGRKNIIQHATYQRTGWRKWIHSIWLNQTHTLWYTNSLWTGKSPSW